MKTIRQLAAQYLKNFEGSNKCCKDSVRAFAAWVKEKTPPETVSKARALGCVIEEHDNCGKVEVIVHWKGKRCRVLCDKDGIHRGSVVTE